jgi:hypothetical protein
LTASVATEQTAPSSDLRSELSLAAHTATLTFAPNLAAADHAALTAASRPAAGAPVRVARLETNGSLRVATIALGKDDPKGSRYDLWLEGVNDTWRLQITDAEESGAAQAPKVVGQIPLFRFASPGPSPTFSAALVAQTRDAGRLVLRWGPYEAGTDLQFTDPPRRRQTERTPPNVTTNRAHDEDTSALSRARLLAQRNETAISFPDGRRLSASFARQGLEITGPDFPRVASATDGSVVLLTESAVPRLRIEAPLRFGTTSVRTGNQVAGQPGSYGMWLKRAGGGWRLVLNHEADAWGSQHEPKSDAAEISLTHSDRHPASRPFAVGLMPIGADRGRLVIQWGPHEWTADFVKE